MQNLGSSRSSARSDSDSDIQLPSSDTDTDDDKNVDIAVMFGDNAKQPDEEPDDFKSKRDAITSAAALQPMSAEKPFHKARSEQLNVHE